MEGGGVLGAGENSDSSRPTTPGSSGVSRTLGASGGRDGQAAWPPTAADGCGGGCCCCGRLHAEKGGSGLGTGGNSDSGGPDDAVPDGDISRASAGAAEGASS